ncbi:hypothetical protein [Kitasatospora purpeofusca]|uniref:hypothetical protein n=1 Tax=Kitasatospora purpeofusca TaxID=67352 RepID=UPI0022554D14|nr:hypothetical protein [Kitasatospora purpeofusca]MCX4758684.1 hypothetical protein [Kitasatospora purpeofusca]WSR30882.1 hypothetical protein OG715_07805 [Kitasatospora purpeofusca]
MWASRTQVLGAVAGHNDVLRHWGAEEPAAFGLTTLHTRVAVDQALLVGQRQPASRDTVALEGRARQWCWLAASVLGGDPVPWLGLLTLAQLDLGQARLEHRVPAPDQMLPPGPWGLFDQARRTDPWGREAFHRMLRFWLACGESGPATDFLAAYKAIWPEGSALHALPLYLYVDRYRRAERKEAVQLQWTNDETVRDTVLRAFGHWRAALGQGSRWPVADESHLAHALWASRQRREAAEVFSAMAPFISLQPWQSLAADRPGELLRQAMVQSYAVTG